MTSANPYESPRLADDAEQSVPAELPHEIRLRGTMPWEDVIHAQLLIARRRWRVVVFGLATYIGAGLILSRWEHPAAEFLLTGMVIIALLCPASFASLYLRLARQARRQQGPFAPTESTLGNAGIRARTGDKSFTLSWSAFESFLVSPRVVILFLKHSNAYLIVSRAKLANPGDWEPLVGFLARTIGY